MILLHPRYGESSKHSLWCHALCYGMMLWDDVIVLFPCYGVMLYGVLVMLWHHAMASCYMFALTCYGWHHKWCAYYAMVLCYGVVL